jgi:hypothetical protein
MNENTIAAAEAALNSNKPKIYLPTDGRSISEFAAQLGEHLRKAEAELFIRGMKVVEARPPERNEAAKICEVDPERFRTWVEDYVVTMQKKRGERGEYELITSMSRDHAAAVLKSPQFHKCLRPLVYIFACGIPAYATDGSVRLLRRGYDPGEMAYVCGPDDYADEVKSVAEAKAVLFDIFSEFQFDDDGRSLSVAVAAMLTPFTRLLLRPGDTFPAFAYTANDVGAGKTLCAKIATITAFGSAKIESPPESAEEAQKKLATATLEGAGYILFDNVSGKVVWPALEAYCTSGETSDRLLGHNKSVTGVPGVIYLTGNEMKVRPDLFSRMLWVELFMPDPDPSCRKFRRDLAEFDIKAMRRRLLAACYRLTMAWVEAGRPVQGSQSSRFKEWAKVVGSILSFHEFVDPTTRPQLKHGEMDEADQAREALLTAVPGRKYTLTELLDEFKEGGAFEEKLRNWEGESTDPGVSRKIRAEMGATLGRMRRRLYGQRMLHREGPDKKRLFWVEEMRVEVPA